MLRCLFPRSVSHHLDYRLREVEQAALVKELEHHKKIESMSEEITKLQSKYAAFLGGNADWLDNYVTSLTNHGSSVMQMIWFSTSLTYCIQINSRFFPPEVRWNTCATFLSNLYNQTAPRPRRTYWKRWEWRWNWALMRWNRSKVNDWWLNCTILVYIGTCMYNFISILYDDTHGSCCDSQKKVWYGASSKNSLNVLLALENKCVLLSSCKCILLNWGYPL